MESKLSQMKESFLLRPKVIYVWFSHSLCVLFAKKNEEGKCLKFWDCRKMSKSELETKLCNLKKEWPGSEIMLVCSRSDILQKDISLSQESIPLTTIESIFPFPSSDLSWGIRSISSKLCRITAVLESRVQYICHIFKSAGFFVRDIVCEDQVFEIASRSLFKGRPAFWYDSGEDRVIAAIIERSSIKKIIVAEKNSSFDEAAFLEEVSLLLNSENLTELMFYYTSWNKDPIPQMLLSYSHGWQNKPFWGVFIEGLFRIPEYPCISLLPKAQKKQMLEKSRKQFLHQLLIKNGLFVLLASGAAFFPLLFHSWQLIKIEKKVMALDSDVKHIRSSRIEVMMNSKQKRENILSLMDRLSQKKFDGLVLSELRINEKEFNVRAESPAHALAYDLLSDLQNSSLGQSVSIKSFQRRQKAGKEFYVFEMLGLWKS